MGLTEHLSTIKYPWASQLAPAVKTLPANAGDARDSGLVLGSGRSPGEGHGHPLQYSCLENPMDSGAWWITVHRVAESDTSEVTTHSQNIHKTFGTFRNVLDIWFCQNHLTCVMVMEVLNRTKFQGPFVMDREHYGCFRQDQVSTNQKTPKYVYVMLFQPYI